MPVPILEPVAPAAAPESPAAPVATAPEPAVEKKSSLLSNILNLVSPEELKIEAAKKEEIAKKVEAPAAPVASAPEPKKVPVKKKEAFKLPMPEITSAVTQAVKDAMPAPVAAPVAPVAAVPVDTDLTPEEKEEIDLAAYAETKDASKKGLANQYRNFIKAQKEFLQQRAASEGEDYDPTTDPKYKAFVAKNEPKFTVQERKALFREKTIEEAETRAVKTAESRIRPEIDKMQRRVLQIEETPRIAERVSRFVNESTDGMPDDLVKFYNENGKDLDKVTEAFPVEAPLVMATLRGSAALAHEFLSIRANLKDFNPADNMHAYLDDFVTKQANNFLANGGEYLVRDGKQFVHPKNWNPKLAGTHWTFGDDDVLAGLKVSAQREAKSRVEASRASLVAANAAAARRATAPSGAAPAVTQPATPAAKIPVTPPAPSAGAGSATATPARSVLSSILNLG